uniref:Uncharacterized protein n=1 Tax=Anguilla anguilla TaxID=7936 RepID=A0A0E9WMU8_ANGAN
MLSSNFFFFPKQWEADKNVIILQAQKNVRQIITGVVFSGVG